MNIDKKLDEVFGSIAKDIINYDFVEIVDNKELKRCLLIEQANFRKYMLDQIPKIKELFQELIDEVAKDFKPELVDMAHKDYHPEIAPGFSIGFNLAKQLIIDRTKRLMR